MSTNRRPLGFASPDFPDFNLEALKDEAICLRLGLTSPAVADSATRPWA